MALKGITTLIKLHKRRIDVLRRELVALEDEKRQLLELSQSLADELAREMELSATDARIAGFFGPYAQRIRTRRDKIAEEVQKLDLAIGEKVEAVREEFGEQKKYEIARDQIRKRQNEEIRRQQQQRFDEIAAQQYGRAHERENPS